MLFRLTASLRLLRATNDIISLSGTVDTELHARLGSRTGIHLSASVSQLAAEVLQSSSQEEPTWIDLGSQRRKRVRALPNSANSKKKYSASPSSLSLGIVSSPKLSSSRRRRVKCSRSSVAPPLICNQSSIPWSRTRRGFATPNEESYSDSTARFSAQWLIMDPCMNSEISGVKM